MNNLISVLFKVSLILIVISPQLFSQSHQGNYMHIDYLNIDNKEVRHFESQIEPVLKPIQQARINSNDLIEWYVYRVAYPGTQNSFYNYVVISICDQLCSFEDIETQIADDFSETEFEEILDSYYELLVPNHSELWKINNSILRNDDSKPSRYFGMDYMKVKSGMEYAYQMMEDEVARPLHEHRMELETMEGWELYGLITPGGTEYGYNFATGNFYNNIQNIEFGFTEELIRQNHPDTNINEFFNNIDDTRDLVRSELWEIVDYIKR